MNGYWTSYEINDNQIATWSDYAVSEDEFIKNLLGRETNIKRFTEIFMDEQDGKAINPPQKINIRKYNQMIKT